MASPASHLSLILKEPMVYVLDHSDHLARFLLHRFVVIVVLVGNMAMRTIDIQCNCEARHGRSHPARRHVTKNLDVLKGLVSTTANLVDGKMRRGRETRFF
jgi:hypothetical protein